MLQCDSIMWEFEFSHFIGYDQTGPVTIYYQFEADSVIRYNAQEQRIKTYAYRLYTAEDKVFIDLVGHRKEVPDLVSPYEKTTRFRVIMRKEEQEYTLILRCRSEGKLSLTIDNEFSAIMVPNACTP